MANLQTDRLPLAERGSGAVRSAFSTGRADWAAALQIHAAHPVGDDYPDLSVLPGLFAPVPGDAPRGRSLLPGGAFPRPRVPGDPHCGRHARRSRSARLIVMTEEQASCTQEKDHEDIR